MQRFPSLSVGTGKTGTLLIEDDRRDRECGTGAWLRAQDFTTNDSEVAAIDLQTGQLKTTFGTEAFALGLGL